MPSRTSLTLGSQRLSGGVSSQAVEGADIDVESTLLSNVL